MRTQIERALLSLFCATALLACGGLAVDLTGADPSAGMAHPPEELTLLAEWARPPDWVWRALASTQWPARFVTRHLPLALRFPGETFGPCELGDLSQIDPQAPTRLGAPAVCSTLAEKRHAFGERTDTVATQRIVGPLGAGIVNYEIHTGMVGGTAQYVLDYDDGLTVHQEGVLGFGSARGGVLHIRY